MFKIPEPIKAHWRDMSGNAKWAFVGWFRAAIDDGKAEEANEWLNKFRNQ
jgi:hypothetical protein